MVISNKYLHFGLLQNILSNSSSIHSTHSLRIANLTRNKNNYTKLQIKIGGLLIIIRVCFISHSFTFSIDSQTQNIDNRHIYTARILFGANPHARSRNIRVQLIGFLCIISICFFFHSGFRSNFDLSFVSFLLIKTKGINLKRS